MELQSGLIKVASYRKKLPRKAKNIYLPTEVWVDVFCYPWATRPKMGEMVDKIGNRWFGEQLQFYLHEWGKHTLGKLYFTDQGVRKLHNDRFQPLGYPQTAMPENIRFCQSLQISHFDNRVFNFFRRIQSLLTADTTLEIRYIRDYIREEADNARTILGHLLPLIDGIHTIRTDGSMMPIVNAFPPEKFHKIKVLDVHFVDFVQSAMSATIEWLTTSSSGPKLLQVTMGYFGAKEILDTICEQFVEAKGPSTFAVVFLNNYKFPTAFRCENGIGEKMFGMQKGPREFQVFRHQANAEAGAKLRAWLDGIMDMDGVRNRKYCIRLSRPIIGPGNIFALPDLDEEDADEIEDEDEKPSTSEKMSICK